ncbi:MAG: hypothetical protein EPN53_02030 [Acidobacteria bacterium]|nr:MAG: hypothetical protein EPN53_02030 [Acidobacteriota bacterium]
MHVPTALLAPAAIAALACAGADTARPADVPAAPARRVVLLSLDGFAAGRHLENLRAGIYADPDGVAAFAGSFVAERAIPVNPTLTAPSHAAIATGAFPAATGIVANVFRLPGAPIGQETSGFEAPWGAEPLWEAFRRQGKRVGVLEFPGCDGTAPSRTADFGATYVNTPFARARTLTFAASRFTTAALPPGWTSASPARRATFTVNLAGAGLPATATFTLTALASSGDGAAAYDTLVADDDADLTNGVLARVHAGEWFPLRLRAPDPDGGSRTIGGWCVLRALPPDLDGVTVYRGGFYATEAYPRAFREALEAGAGFWPGPPDECLPDRGGNDSEGVTLTEMLAQMRRFSEYFTACARTAVERERFDLLVLYQPIVDEVEHRSLLVDPRQLDYTPAHAATARTTVTEAFRAGDRAVGELARTLDLTRDALVVVSDHGMAPVWESVEVNQLLQEAGLAAGEKVGKGWRVAPRSRMAAYAGGGCAHLYVNLKGRDAGGVVDPAEMKDVVRAAAVALARAQVEGSNVVETIIPREGLAAVGLDAPASGDLVVFFRPGFSADSGIGAPGAPWHAPAELCGRHGYLNTHREMAAIWLARGAGVPHRRVAEASLTEVAAFVSRLAGVEPPRRAHP